MNYELFLDIFRAKRRPILLLALLVVAGTLLYVYRSEWQEPELARAQGAYFAARAAAGGGSGATQRAKRYQSAQHDLAQFQERLIAKKDFARFLNELFDTAGHDRLNLKGITYKPTVVKEQGVVQYAMTLSVEGKYPAVKSFISDLCRFPQMVTVDALSITNSSSTEEAVELQLQITAYLKTEGA